VPQKVPRKRPVTKGSYLGPFTAVARLMEFRDLGPVPIARRKVIAALGGTAAQPGRPAKPRRPTQGAGRESGGAPRLQRRRRDPSWR
jgi:hypothetical protein